RVGVLERDVVALLLEDDLPQVRGGLALGPAVEHTDREGGLVAAVRVSPVRLAVGRASGEPQRRDGAHGERREQSLLHVFSFPPRAVSVAIGVVPSDPVMPSASSAPCRRTSCPPSRDRRVRRWCGPVARGGRRTRGGRSRVWR